MRVQRSYPTPEKGTPAHWDRKVQRVVLGRIVEVYPVQLTVSELVRELAVGDPVEFGTRDEIKRAAFDLVGLGILHRHDFLRRDDSLFIPTRTTLHLYALLEDDER